MASLICYILLPYSSKFEILDFDEIIFAQKGFSDIFEYFQLIWKIIY